MITTFAHKPKTMTSEEIISINIIKPSSPTPTTFKTHPLSFLDQIGPPMYIPLVFFYQHNTSKPNSNHAEVSKSLKQSLSQILTHFYPLAGTLQENSFIDCDDSGVEFIESRVNAPLSHFTENPKIEKLRQLIPAESSAHTSTALVAMKLSFFDCGGFSMGVSWSHKIGDFASYIGFMTAWATACRGETLISPPSFDLALRFPPRASPIEHHRKTKEDIATKRFVFNKEMLEKIRAESACDEVKNPTRVESLSAFIWKMFVDATKEKRGPRKSSFAALQCVNLRPRSVPPIPEETFGNCYIGKFAFTSDGGMKDLVSSLRAAIRSVDDDYIKNVVSDEEYLRIVDEANESIKKGETEFCNFSSWLGFPIYEVDFGWGKPYWVCTVTHPRKNLVILMTTPQGDGIEAWIGLPLDFSDIFQTAYNKLLINY